LSSYLVEPTLQVTTNDGASWTTVSDTSTYMSIVGANGYGVSRPSTVDFTLTTPATDIDGIRVIGESGGLGVHGGGFIGVGEENVYGMVAPEPSSGALLLGGLGLLGIALRVAGNRIARIA
jgi:hypothetical protein